MKNAIQKNQYNGWNNLKAKQNRSIDQSINQSIS